MKYRPLQCHTPNGAAAAAAPGRHVVFTSLKCNVTEDSGADECILRVHYRSPDGVPRQHEFRRDMNAGQTWTLPATGFPLMNGDMEAKLWDEDGPFDPDDYLGGVFIRSNLPPGNYFVDFTLDDANYRLELRIDP
jgi:hypothetical protein